MKIVIVGAGIGGLAAALSLQAAGFHDVVVHERVRELKPLGVGINLLPHAVRELTELGLGEQVAAIGVPPGRLSYANRFGQPVWSEPRGLDAGYRWPQLSVHRGEFQLLLAREVEARLGSGAIRLGQRFDGVEHRGDTEIARFTDAAGRESAVEADLVVGADGIHSATAPAVVPRRGRAAVERTRALARDRDRAAVPRRPHHDHGRRRRAEVRGLPARGSGHGLGDEPHQLHRRAARARGRRRDRRLEPPGRRGAHRRALRRLAVRLARRAGGHRCRRRDPRVPDGRPRAPAAVDVRADHPDRRRRPRALPERVERRLAGDHRRAHARVRAGDAAERSTTPSRRTRRSGVPRRRACTR